MNISADQPYQAEPTGKKLLKRPGEQAQRRHCTYRPSNFVAVKSSIGDLFGDRYQHIVSSIRLWSCRGFLGQLRDHNQNLSWDLRSPIHECRNCMRYIDFFHIRDIGTARACVKSIKIRTETLPNTHPHRSPLKVGKHDGERCRLGMGGGRPARGDTRLAQLSLLAPSGDDFGGVKAQESESHQRGALATRL